MIKKDLVNRIASLGLPKKKAREVMEAIIEGISEGLARGERVQLRGLGSFNTRIAKEKKGRNLQTGEPLKIPSRRVPLFRAAPVLKEKVRLRPRGGSAPEGKCAGEKARKQDTRHKKQTPNNHQYPRYNNQTV